MTEGFILSNRIAVIHCASAAGFCCTFGYCFPDRIDSTSSDCTSYGIGKNAFVQIGRHDCGSFPGINLYFIIGVLSIESNGSATFVVDIEVVLFNPPGTIPVRKSDLVATVNADCVILHSGNILRNHGTFSAGYGSLSRRRTGTGFYIEGFGDIAVLITGAVIRTDLCGKSGYGEGENGDKCKHKSNSTFYESFCHNITTFQIVFGDMKNYKFHLRYSGVTFKSLQNKKVRSKCQLRTKNASSHLLPHKVCDSKKDTQKRAYIFDKKSKVYP